MGKLSLLFLLAWITTTVGSETAHCELPPPEKDGRIIDGRAGGRSAAEAHRTKNYTSQVDAQGNRPTLKGGYCSGNMQTMTTSALSEITIVPPPSYKPYRGADYGTYLQSYFLAVCGTYSNEMSFKEVCPTDRLFSDAHDAGVRAGEKVAKTHNLPQDYCEGDKQKAGEQARTSFIAALMLANAQDQKEYGQLGPDAEENDDKDDKKDKQLERGLRKREFVRGFTEGLCMGYASVPCDQYVSTKKNVTTYETLIKNTGTLSNPDAVSTLETDERSGKKSEKKSPVISPPPSKEPGNGNEAG